MWNFRAGFVALSFMRGLETVALKILRPVLFHNPCELLLWSRPFLWWPNTQDVTVVWFSHGSNSKWTCHSPNSSWWFWFDSYRLKEFESCKDTKLFSAFQTCSTGLLATNNGSNLNSSWIWFWSSFHLHFNLAMNYFLTNHFDVLNYLYTKMLFTKMNFKNIALSSWFWN